MGVSGQRHAPTALYPRGKDPRYPSGQSRHFYGAKNSLPLDPRAKKPLLALLLNNNSSFLLLLITFQLVNVLEIATSYAQT
jgi:hypothetical protein